MQAPPSADLPNPAGGTPIVNQIIDAFGMVIYFTLGVLAVWGIYNIILVFSGLKSGS